MRVLCDEVLMLDFDEGANQVDDEGEHASESTGRAAYNKKLATDHISAFEKLMTAYGQIAAMLPRFDRQGNALQNEPDLQQALAVVYSDILEFHRHSYKFLRKNGKVHETERSSCSILTSARLDVLLQIFVGPI